MTSLLLVLSVALPFVLALGYIPRRWRGELQRVLPLAPLPGLVLGLAGGEAVLELPWLLEGAAWGIDDSRRVFMAFTSLIWSVAGLDAAFRLAGRARREHFALFWLLCLCGNLGLILALDIAGFYTFFSLMTLAAYGLVAHAQHPAARRAGRLYVAMAVAGEMVLLAGLIMAAAPRGLILMADIPAAVSASEQRDLLFAMLFFGFGVKAGLPLLHFWLPPAYLAAPVPGSAVLGGAMLNAGLLGWLFTLPLGMSSMPWWGEFLAVLGLCAAFGGVALGLCQRRAKALLGYSSISQMGLIVLLLGTALADPDAAPSAVAACILFAMHHGLAKSALFLAVGVAPHWGFSRPLFLLLAALPGLSLAGVVLSSGAAAKGGFKELLGQAESGFAFAALLPLLLSLAAVGTTLLIARFVLCLSRYRTRRVFAPALLIGWGLALGASLLAFWWLPRPADLPLAPAGEPGLLGLTAGLGHPLDYLWPPALGLLLALAALALRLRAPAVPPGDLAAMLERFWYRRRAGLQSWARGLTRLRGHQRKGRAWAGAGLLLQASRLLRGERLARSRAEFAFLLLLAALLALLFT